MFSCCIVVYSSVHFALLMLLVHYATFDCGSAFLIIVPMVMLGVLLLPLVVVDEKGPLHMIVMVTVAVVVLPRSLKSYWGPQMLHHLIQIHCDENYVGHVVVFE